VGAGVGTMLGFLALDVYRHGFTPRTGNVAVKMAIFSAVLFAVALVIDPMVRRWAARRAERTKNNSN
jgi:hypothetical protein